MKIENVAECNDILRRIGNLESPILECDGAIRSLKEGIEKEKARPPHTPIDFGMFSIRVPSILLLSVIEQTKADLESQRNSLLDKISTL